MLVLEGGLTGACLEARLWSYDDVCVGLAEDVYLVEKLRRYQSRTEKLAGERASRNPSNMGIHHDYIDHLVV